MRNFPDLFNIDPTVCQHASLFLRTKQFSYQEEFGTGSELIWSVRKVAHKYLECGIVGNESALDGARIAASSRHGPIEGI